MKKATILKEPSPFATFVCNGCGWEYDPAIGDPEADVSMGTLFEALPEEWICPMCGEEKDNFVQVGGEQPDEAPSEDAPVEEAPAKEKQKKK